MRLVWRCERCRHVKSDMINVKEIRVVRPHSTGADTVCTFSGSEVDLIIVLDGCQICGGELAYEKFKRRFEELEELERKGEIDGKEAMRRAVKLITENPENFWRYIRERVRGR